MTTACVVSMLLINDDARQGQMQYYWRSVLQIAWKFAIIGASKVGHFAIGCYGYTGREMFNNIKTREVHNDILRMDGEVE